LRIPHHSSNIEIDKGEWRLMSDHHVNTSGEQLLGITRDAVLRPVGALMIVVGVLWALFVGMAAEAGTYGQPLAAIALIFLGVLAVTSGRHSEED
jgi:hypothetical protein